MTKDKKDIRKTDRSIFSILEIISESVGWLQIVAFPLFVGLVTGALIYFPNPSRTTLIFGIIVAFIGLVAGIIWATKQWKGKGTMWLTTRIMATPELDNPDEADKTTPNNKAKHKANHPPKSGQ